MQARHSYCVSQLSRNLKGVRLSDGLCFTFEIAHGFFERVPPCFRLFRFGGRAVLSSRVIGNDVV